MKTGLSLIQVKVPGGCLADIESQDADTDIFGLKDDFISILHHTSPAVLIDQVTCSIFETFARCAGMISPAGLT